MIKPVIAFSFYASTRAAVVVEGRAMVLLAMDDGFEGLAGLPEAWSVPATVRLNPAAITDDRPMI
jgi:hypothetical protein